MHRRCKYHCTVEDAEGIPSFTIRVEDVEHKEELVFRGKTPRGNEKLLFHIHLCGVLHNVLCLSNRCLAADSCSDFEQEERGGTHQFVPTIHHWRGKQEKNSNLNKTIIPLSRRIFRGE